MRRCKVARVLRYCVHVAICCSVLQSSSLESQSKIGGQDNIELERLRRDLGPTGLVVLAKGPLKLKRPGWRGYSTTAFGTAVFAGDLLQTNDSSHATVVCDDLTLRDVPIGISAIPCSAKRSVLRWGDGTLIMTSRMVAPQLEDALRRKKQIEKLGLSEGPTQYLIAHSYFVDDWYEVSIKLLEQIAPKFDVSAVERLLGNSYEGIEHFGESNAKSKAELHYRRALVLSLEDDDDEGQIFAHEGLARCTNDLRAKFDHLHAAVALAKKLGDDPAVQRLIRSEEEYLLHP